MREGTFVRAVVLTFIACLLAAAAPVAGASARDRRAVRGSLEVVQEDDFASGRTVRSYRLREDLTGRIYTLRFPQEPETRLSSGARIVVRGRVRDREIVVDPDAASLDVLAAAEAPAAEARRAVVLVADFSDSAVSCSDASIAGLMFDGASSVDGLYRAASFGRVSLPGDTDGDGLADVFRVAIGRSVAESCDAYGWASAAETAAVASGVDLTLYQHRVFVLPGNVSCSWAGLGNVGCSGFCRAWVKTCNLPDVYAHEVGHNLDLAHASTDGNNDGAVDCEYCDTSDFMGYGGVGWRLLNGPHQQQKAWLPAGQIVEVSGSGTATHVLSPLQLDPASAPYPQLLKMRKPDSGDWYFLSYRQRAGYDAALGTGYADRTNVHRYSGSGYSNTLFVTALQDGQLFDDPVNGLSVRQLSHDAVSVTLQISTTCVAATPSVTLSPTRQSGRAGTELGYTLTVRNQDPGSCGGSTFDLAAGLPAGWSATLSPGSLTLAPGGQGQSALRVLSPAGAPEGDHSLLVQVANAAESAHLGTAGAVYAVDATPPGAITDLRAAIKRKSQIELVWTAPADPGSGVASYRVLRNGALLATTTTAYYLDRATTSGATYDYTVIALDGAGNASTPSNVVRVSLSGTTGGGGGKGGGKPH